MEFNLAQVHEAVEAAVPDRECIVFRDRRLTYGDLGDRSRRLANVLLDAGLGKVRDRATLANHESGQDHLAIYLHNGNEYLESMLGAYKARLAPFNVNYRYVAEELEYLLRDAHARAIVYHSAFAPTLAAIRDRIDGLDVLLQVDDGSGQALLPGARWYEETLAAAAPVLPAGLAASWSPDDLYILYTGGTTGMPKGVLWRQGDIFVGALGGRRLDTREEWTSLDEIVANAANGGTKALPGPPFMHGAAHWMAFNSFTNANTLCLPSVPEHLDPADVLALIERERVNVLLIVGDAFGRPLVEEIERGGHDLSSLLITVSGGAALSPGIKERLLAAVPTMMVLDGLGASETGQQASQLTSAGQAAVTGTFTPGPGMCILSEELDRVLPEGHPDMGWLAQSGRVPTGYLGDEAKTARTFPVIDGVRYSVPGDRARVTADGTLELYGRDSATINSGGEKIFAEEVEQALLRHPSVADCLVAGRPSERWGNEVVAVVQLGTGIEATDEDLLEEASRHIARYKLPKAIVRVEAIRRSPSGKADYRWAKETAAADS
jgi:3-oxocholest-4-en-26-oate---CoA ligase